MTLNMPTKRVKISIHQKKKGIIGYLYKVFLTFCLTLSLLNSGITNSFSLGGNPKSFLLLASPILKKSIKSIILYGTYLVLNTLFIIVLVTINI